MKNYNDLTPKGKFIRTAICVPIFWACLIAVWVFLSTYFILGIGAIVKLVVASVVIVMVSIWQLVTTYQAWKRDDDY